MVFARRALVIVILIATVYLSFTKHPGSSKQSMCVNLNLKATLQCRHDYLQYNSEETKLQRGLKIAEVR